MAERYSRLVSANKTSRPGPAVSPGPGARGKDPGVTQRGFWPCGQQPGSEPGRGAAAVKFPEYLSGDQAQKYFADGNNEYPAGLQGPGGTRRELVPNREAGLNSVRGRQGRTPAGDGMGRVENIVLILTDSD